MINSQATRNLFGHPDLESWVSSGATGKKFLNHRLMLCYYVVLSCMTKDDHWIT